MGPRVDMAQKGLQLWGQDLGWRLRLLLSPESVLGPLLSLELGRPGTGPSMCVTFRVGEEGGVSVHLGPQAALQDPPPARSPGPFLLQGPWAVLSRPLTTSQLCRPPS